MKQHRKTLARIAQTISTERTVTVAEVGVASGKTSKYLLEKCPNVHVYLVDPWSPPPVGSHYAVSGHRHSKLSRSHHQQLYRHVIRSTQPWESRRTIVREWSPEAATEFSDREMDVVFLDGSHHEDDVAADIQAWWPKVSGVLCGHDWYPEHENGVWRAVSSWVQDSPGLAVEAFWGKVWAVWKQPFDASLLEGRRC